MCSWESVLEIESVITVITGQEAIMLPFHLAVVHMAYPDVCQHKLTFLLRLRPYSVREHRLCVIMLPLACTDGTGIRSFLLLTGKAYTKCLLYSSKEYI